MSIIKRASHVFRLLQHQKGKAFVVCGYPRSGTTFLSEVVSYSSKYYFDRNNKFPQSIPSVWHTHWSPNFFSNNQSVSIIRNPIDVAISLENYCYHYNIRIKPQDLLEKVPSSPTSWINYYKKCLNRGISIISYEKIINGNDLAVKHLADLINSKSEIIDKSIELINLKHKTNMHKTDLDLSRLKNNMDIPRLSNEEKRRYFEAEIEFYEKFK